MKHFITSIVAVFFALALLWPVSTNCQRKLPHLIVGNWQKVDHQPAEPSQIGKSTGKARWFFSSDGFSSELIMYAKSKEKIFSFRYKILSNKEEPTKPFLQLVQTNNSKQIIVFKILELTKKLFLIQLEEDKTNTTILLPTTPLEYERIAGPPENME